MLVILMCSLASFSILYGKTKKRTSFKRIAILSATALILQSIYLATINSKVLTSVSYSFLYLSILLFSLIPFYLIKYEDKVSTLFKKNKDD